MSLESKSISDAEEDKIFESGHMLLMAGKYDDAISAFKTLVEHGLDHYTYLVATAYEAKGTTEALGFALHYYQKAALLEGKYNLDVGRILLKIHTNRDDLSTAILHFKQAMYKQSKMGAQFGLGLAYLQDSPQKDIILAKKHLKAASDLGHVMAKQKLCALGLKQGHLHLLPYFFGCVYKVAKELNINPQSPRVLIRLDISSQV